MTKSRASVRVSLRSVTVLAALLSGCFSYVPAELDTVPAGEEVRVYLTRDALEQVREVRPVEGSSVTGTLVRRSGGELLVRVPVTARQRGFMVESLGQDVVIQAAQVIQVERREMNRLGTAATIVGSTAAAGAIIVLIVQGARGGEVDEGPGNTEMTVPLFRIPVP